MPQMGPWPLLPFKGTAPEPPAREYLDATKADAPLLANWHMESRSASKVLALAISTSLYEEARWAPKVPCGSFICRSTALTRRAGSRLEPPSLRAQWLRLRQIRPSNGPVVRATGSATLRPFSSVRIEEDL